MADARKRSDDAGDEHDAITAALTRRYKAGASIHELAESTGKSSAFIRRILTDAGVPLRSADHTPPEDAKRAEAHRLLDQVPEERIPDATEFLRALTRRETTRPTRRRFRTVGVFDGEPNLGRRAKEIARQEIGRDSGKTA
ncbi:helix-turn-helix domain-containing protein [Haloechinothrix halophila]|uniref:helix-turn-helix domain-containing protein n=1 Tax=Haloechinothrix halophila TaxID=1069073 RepID=UPI001E2CAD23|nr:helix-turn-helix domain-containing protein [Haloechinothrix halophila]